MPVLLNATLLWKGFFKPSHAALLKDSLQIHPAFLGSLFQGWVPRLLPALSQREANACFSHEPVMSYLSLSHLASLLMHR